MSLSLFYFFTVTAVHVLMGWSFYLPYRLQRLHFTSVANMAVSAYLCGYASIEWGISFVSLLVLGTLMGALTGYLVSYAIGDAPAFTTAIVGLALISLTKIAIENSAFLGGTLGLFGIPSVAADPSMSRFRIMAVAWGSVLLVGFALFRFERSRFGLAAATIFANRDLAGTLGIDIRALAITAQTGASAIGGLAGVIYAFTMRGLFPDYFTFRYVGILMTILFVGGHTVPWGVLIATPILWGAPLLLPESVQSWRVVLYAVTLVVVLLAKPEGLVTRRTVRRVRAYLRRRPPTD